MNIGIFGDSYATIGHDELQQGWPYLIKSTLNATIDFYGKSGTSLYWSYELFKKHYKKYDVIIFCFTSGARWPCLPKENEGNHWNIGYIKDDSFLDQINTYFFSLFPSEFLNFINHSIHADIVKTCEQENKYLVQIMPFLEHHIESKDGKQGYDIYASKFPIVSGLDKVSHLEEIEIDNNRTNTGKYLSENKIIDFRVCHLNKSNNIIIANYIVDFIKNKSYDVRFYGELYNNWVIFDKSDTDYINTLKEEGLL